MTTTKRSARRVVRLVASCAVVVRALRSAGVHQGVPAPQTSCTGRRRALGLLVGGTLSRAAIIPPPARALENAVPEAAQYADRPKRPGPKPTDLGLKDRDNVDSDEPELRLCGGAPNCFSTTPDDVAPEHVIARWVAPKGLSRADAYAQIRDAVRRYAPGQSGIDGGGFRIVTDDADRGFLYAQFESLKNGYVDDLELAFPAADDASRLELRVRSSSRVGYLDFGVNAKRLNAISATLREAHDWTAPAITAQTHPIYFQLNAPKPDQVAPSTAFYR